MGWQDVRGFYEDPQDKLDLIDKDIDEMRCEWDLKEVPCEECKRSDEGHECYFLSDGGEEPRDGTYLCRNCARKRFA